MGSQAERQVELRGGPFDGDSARMDEPLPARLYAYPCPSGGSPRCNYGGVHWTHDAFHGGRHGAEIYHRADDTETVVYYDHVDLAGALDNVHRELAEAVS